MLNTLLIFKNSFSFHVLVTLAMLFSFYYYVKGLIFHLSPTLALKTTAIKHYPLSQIVGVIELSIVSICHVIFCILLLSCFKINISSICKNTSILSCFYGVLIGIGSVGLSILLCSVGMKIFEIIAKDKSPKSIEGWMAVANAGWIRHHKHTIKVLPFYISLLIITLQIGSEEVIFRVVLNDVFMPYGIEIAFVISTGLFIFMQTLHMPSMASAMFPILGATVMGIIHGLIYIHNPSIVPLIISHLTFFMFTVI